MSITMIFGAMVAGMTSEGGGAVAFPVMTLALHISPAVARDFSLGIQSCGMSAAAFTIFWMKLKLEKHSLLFCSVGKTSIIHYVVKLQKYFCNLTKTFNFVYFLFFRRHLWNDIWLRSNRPAFGPTN